MNKETDIQNNNLFKKVATLIEQSRQAVVSMVNLTMVHTYFEIGRMIVDDEQEGKERAEYGKGILKDLSQRLTQQFGKGFSVENLDRMRFFFKVYSGRISSSVLTKLANQEDLISATALRISENQNNTIQQTASVKPYAFKLSWSHYLILMRIENANERNFYEIEAANEQWSVSQLKRQYHSSLYERLALSRNKEEVLRLANEGQTIEKASDLLKNPFTLEFLGLEEKESYLEKDLEKAITDKLQSFLLELGKGFLFEARQKRFTFDERHFYVDLVFYNRLLQCYVLIDLKTDELSHQDLGQMQMYVNYFDRYVKQNFEKPTIGILLCKKKNDTIIELTLPKDASIYASEYSLYLPNKELLQQKVSQWTKELDTIGIQ